MRGFKIKLGVATTLCAFGVMAAPALAHHEHPKAVFGKFIANYPLAPGAITPTTPTTDKGIGSVEEINLGDGGLVIKEEPGKLSGCAVRSTGKVEEESSEKFFQAITLSRCYAVKPFGKDGDEKIKLKKFHLDFLYNSNGSLNIGEGEGEIKITANSTLSIPVGKNVCTVVIPQQTLPAKALVKPGEEYEAAEYETEVNKEVKLKKFPAGFQNKLDIEMHFDKVENWVRPTSSCEFPPGEVDEEVGSPAYGYVVFKKGSMAMELEEINIKEGNLGFETKAEVEEKEKEA